VIPLTDIIPTRTPPIMTVALIAASVLLSAGLMMTGVTVLAINMLYLWLFGRSVEDRLGHARFAACYAVCAATVWIVAGPAEALAAGVTAVIGAYFALFPKSSLLVLVPAPVTLFEMPAVFFLGLWALLQLLVGDVWPQLASFVAGVVVSIVLRRPERARVEWWSP
jgi:membrane associated rhomboid family serine protease